MLTIQDKLILKRKVYLQNGQEATKTYKLLRYRHKSQSTQIYDVYDSQLTQQLTLKIMIKNQQLSNEKSINEIKNQQLFVGLPNFVSLYDIYEDNQKIYLVMEKWGDTLADLANERVTMTEYQAQLIFSQLVDIIIELRKRNIAHNFITLQSLYIDIKEKHKIKLGDFKKSFNVASYFENILPENRKLSSNDIQKLQKKLKQQNPLLLALPPKDLNQKLTPYSSPEEVSPSNYSQDYAKFLSALYENDVWNIGIIMFRLLMGRFPFDEEENEDIKYAFEIFGNKKEFDSINKKECCFNFHEKENVYCEPVSVQFKELIKSILKPVNKRIKLKDLLNHSLKLNSYHNVRDVNFQHSLPPLMSANKPAYNSLKPIKSFLFDNYLLGRQIQKIEEQENRWNSNPRLLESNTNNFFNSSESSKRNFQDSSDLNRSRSNKKPAYDEQEQLQEDYKNLQFLSPKANYSLFSIFNEEDPIFSFGKSNKPQASQKYVYTWNINFTQLPQIATEASILEPNSQFDPFRFEKNKKFDTQLNSRKNISDKEKFSISNSGKISTQIRAGDNFEGQTEQNDSNFSQTEKENNGIKKNFHKRVPSASLHKRQLMKSVYNTGNFDVNGNSMKSATFNNQFNIRSINSKKKIQNSTLFSLNERKATFQKGETNFENPSIPEEPGNFQVKSLANSRIFSSKGYPFGNSLEGLKPNMKKYKGKQDEICESEEIAESVSAPFQRQKKQIFLLSLQMVKEREAQILILKNQVESLPLLVEEPEFVMQYKFKKEENSLGYVLNNGIGVIFESGKQIIGHNQNDFIILKRNAKMLDGKYSFSSQIGQISTSSSEPKSLTPSQIQIYHDFLKLFGKRMVISNFSIWIQKYWRVGRVFIFLFNNGCWQVTLEGKKTAKFFIIDQNQLIWTKGKINPEILNEVRNIVNKKRRQIMEQSYFFK